MSDVNHLTNQGGKLKKVPFTDTPRDPSEPVRITAVQYGELLTLMNAQMAENARVRGDIVWFKAMAFVGCAVSLALCFFVRF